MNPTRRNHRRVSQRSLTALTAALLILILSLVWPAARAGGGNPPPVATLDDGSRTSRVSQGTKLAFYAYVLGVQLYRWNGTYWVYVEPLAPLFAAADGFEEPAFAAPTAYEKTTAED